VVEVVKSGAGAGKLLLVSKVYIKSLPFENVGGRNRDILTVVSAIYDGDGGYLAGNRNTINLAFSRRDAVISSTATSHGDTVEEHVAAAGRAAAITV
jgi:hypothetical protein